MATCIRPRKSGDSFDETASNSSTLTRQHKNIIQVYTDWANHYLDKAKCKKRIQDLQVDVTDGVVLADVIEAVTNQKIPDVNRKPKTSLQMIENIKSCLNFLAELGVSLDGITAKDVRDGNLKAILGLFFSLSRHKQKQKQNSQLTAEKDKLQKLQQEQRQQQQYQQHSSDEMASQTRLPSPYNRHVGPVTSIPMPSAGIARRGGLEKTRQQGVPSGGGLQQPQVVYKCTSASSSRSTSPSGTNHQYIPVPRTSARNSLIEKQQEIHGSRPSLSSSRTSLRVPVSSPYSQTPGQTKNSMLDKFRLFNSKDKDGKTVIGTSKRTSSSSGFSSARSEHSDSSTSLYSDARQQQQHQQQQQQQITEIHNIQSSENSSPKLRSIRTKIVKTSVDKKEKQNSPKLRRSVDSETSKLQLKFNKSEKVRGIADGERKVTCLESPTQDRNSFPEPKLMKPKTLSNSTMNVQVDNAKPPPTLAVNTSIPKPMAAVKGTSKPLNCSDVMLSPIKSRSPSIVKLPGTDTLTRQKLGREENCNVSIALVSPMRNSAPISDVNSNHPEEKHEEKKVSVKIADMPLISKMKEEDDDGKMNVKPMSPLLNGYRLAAHSSLHFTHPGYINQCQNYKNVYYSQVKGSPNLINLEGIDLAMGYLANGDKYTNGHDEDTNDGYMSEGGASLYAKRVAMQPVIKEDRILLSPITNNKSEERRVSNESRTEGNELSTEQDYQRVLEGSNQWLSHGDPSQHPAIVYRSPNSRPQSKKSDSGQQTDNSAFRPIPPKPTDNNLKYEDHIIRSRDRRNINASPTTNGVKKNADLKHKQKMGVKEDEKIQNGGPTSIMKTNGDSKVKVKGVPSSFGYVKRSTSSSGSGKNETRTAQVSAVPRTKVKVSGGTQTTSDLTHFKSYSLTNPAASQLSQSVRERLMGSQSLPKPGSDYAALLHQHRQSQRQHKPTDGSLSDTAYSNYSDLQSYYSNNSPYSSWLRNNSAYTASLPTRASTGLVDAESLESLSSLPAQLHRASLTHTRMLMHQREGSASPSHRLNRSNSIRSTKSEKLYPSMLQRSEDIDPYYSIPINSIPNKHQQHMSQPTSPTPSQVSQGTSSTSRFNYPLSPISSSTSSHGLNRGNMSIYTPGGMVAKMNSTDDDIHGSSISLVSTASSLYSTAEEKQAHEIRKLRKELQDSQEKVHTLTSQLSTNAHVVSAFEQSLSNMTQRLQHLTATTEKKDQELVELRKSIELLKKQSQDVRLAAANNAEVDGTPCMIRRHTINSDDAASSPGHPAPISRQLSTDSVSSINSLSSACSLSSSSANKSKKKKKGWLRSSFSKAFSRSRKNRNGSVSDVEDFRRIQIDHEGELQNDISAPSSPLLNTPHSLSSSSHNLKNGGSINDLRKDGDESDPELVEDLKKQLREKDLVLTDIRLEALSSAHQLESLKDTVIKMRNELLNLKQDNERLQRIVTSKSLTSSQCSVNHLGSLERRYSLHDPSTASINHFPPDPDSGKRVLVSVLLGCHGVYHKYMDENQPHETVIAAIHVSPKIKWDMLDNIIRRVFKEFVLRIDPVSNLGLTPESMWSYHIGEVVRYADSSIPDLLPCAYLVEEEDTVRICLKGAMISASLDALAFETLIPKSIIQRYMSLLTEHRRIILCGPSGTGKSYLANKLAEFLVLRSGKESTAESIATFNVDHKNSKELRQYLTNVAEQCETNASDLPSVIILDNLHQAASLGEVFNGFLSAKYTKCPFIIGTMNQATCSTTNLQLHHNFRWILCANHMEPVKGFLGRFLRRRSLDTELRDGVHNNDLSRILEWIPKVWHHLNKFIEQHSSSDVTIGPRLFLSCPNDVEASQAWFIDLWNYALVPYIMDAVREGLQLYGRRASWEDPTQFVLQTYPWADETVHGGPDALLRIRPEDVGYDVQAATDSVLVNSAKATSTNENDGDPLLNMLMRLQEAANYSSSQSNGQESSETVGQTTHSDADNNSRLSESFL